MQTLSSREVQNHYGEFVEAVQDELVCVTRHGRPLFWAVADRHVRAADSSVLIGRLLLLHGQLNRDTSALPGDSFNKVLDELDASIDTSGLSLDDIKAMVDDARP